MCVSCLKGGIRQGIGLNKIAIPEISSCETLQSTLVSWADSSLAAFNAKLIPTESPERILGVRMPALRRLAKQLLKQERTTGDSALIDAFIAEDPHTYLEEDQLHMILVTEKPGTVQEAVELIETFATRAHLWVLTDGLVPRIFIQNLDEAKPYIMQWLTRDDLWMQRIALVNLISLYTDDLFDEETMRIAAQRAQEVQEPLSDEYYLNMALAWYLSMCLVKHPYETQAFLEEETLPVWVHNKTLQKTRESRLCSEELKKTTYALKR